MPRKPAPPAGQTLVTALRDELATNSGQLAALVMVVRHTGALVFNSTDYLTATAADDALHIDVDDSGHITISTRAIETGDLDGQEPYAAGRVTGSILDGQSEPLRAGAEG
jgi:hypothetical protein